MSDLNITIKNIGDDTRKFSVEMDADKLESLAASFGLFNPDFIKSLNRAEREYRSGKYKKTKGLKELRK